ncbi:hypothetical protein CSPX01_13890 [Colletotrichum filicis]|nr:hypothetical protein CSPX01_13890 [Colletotrichum filicis]
MVHLEWFDVNACELQPSNQSSGVEIPLPQVPPIDEAENKAPPLREICPEIGCWAAGLSLRRRLTDMPASTSHLPRVRTARIIGNGQGVVARSISFHDVYSRLQLACLPYFSWDPFHTAAKEPQKELLIELALSKTYQQTLRQAN